MGVVGRMVDGFERSPTEVKLMLGGAVVAVAIIGYLAFRKSSSSSSSSRATPAEAPDDAPPDFILIDNDPSATPKKPVKKKPPVKKKTNDHDADDGPHPHHPHDPVKHKQAPTSHDPDDPIRRQEQPLPPDVMGTSGTVSRTSTAIHDIRPAAPPETLEARGGAHPGLIPPVRVYHPLHSAILLSKRHSVF